MLKEKIGIEFSLVYRPKIPLKPIRTNKEFLEFREETVGKYKAQYDLLDEKQKQSFTLESMMTSMGPTQLSVHLDSGFTDRSYHVVPGVESTKNNERFVLAGVPIGGVIEPDSKIIISALTKTFNQYASVCNEDAGVGYIDLLDILKPGIKENLVFDDIPLHYRSRDVPEMKGVVTLRIHKISMPQSVKMGKVLPTHNIKENKQTFKHVMDSCLGTFVAELGSFIPVAKGSHHLNCPVYPSENTFIGASGEESFNMPLATYVISDRVDVCTSFYVNSLRIMIDRKYQSRFESTRVVQKKAVTTESNDIDNSDEDEEETEGVVTEELIEKPKDLAVVHATNLVEFYKYYMNNKTKGRARWMAKFIALYIQTMDYIGDSTYSQFDAVKKATEMFSEILNTGSGDCEDSGAGLIRLYNAFLDTAPHMKLLHRILNPIIYSTIETEAQDPEINSILSKHLPKNKPLSELSCGEIGEIFTMYHKDERFWSDLNLKVTSDIEGYGSRILGLVADINVSTSDGRVATLKLPEDETFNYLGGNVEALIFALILRDFHKIACYYVDTFTLFGVRSTHVQNVPKDGKSTKQELPRKKTDLELMTEDVKDAHAATILWPRSYFRESLGRWDKDHELANEKVYEEWTSDRGYSGNDSIAGFFPVLDESKLEPLILEGTGMLEPSSKKDRIPKTRRYMSTIEVMSVLKKEVNPDHFESPFYQSVILAVSPRFLESHGIATFNVTQSLDIQEVISDPQSELSSKVFTGMRVMEKVMISMQMQSQVSAKLLSKITSSISQDTVRSGLSSSGRGDTNIATNYAKNYLFGDQIYTKGVPFPYVMRQSDKVTFVPVGFMRKEVHQQLNHVKEFIQNKVDAGDSHRILNKIGKHIGAPIPDEGVRSIKDINKVIGLIENNYMMSDKQSIKEFDDTTIGLMKNVAKQKIMVPKITSSKVVNWPVQNSVDLNTKPNTELSRFNLITSAFPLPAKVQGKYVKFSAYFKPVQFPSEKSVENMISGIKKADVAGNLIGIDYNKEQYTNDRWSIRLDFYVKNLE